MTLPEMRYGRRVALGIFAAVVTGAVAAGGRGRRAGGGRTGDR